MNAAIGILEWWPACPLGCLKDYIVSSCLRLTPYLFQEKVSTIDLISFLIETWTQPNVSWECNSLQIFFLRELRRINPLISHNQYDYYSQIKRLSRSVETHFRSLTFHSYKLSLTSSMLYVPNTTSRLTADNQGQQYSVACGFSCRAENSPFAAEKCGIARYI